MKNPTVQLYIQSSCSSSRKAKKWLEEQQILHETVHIVKQGISKELITQILIHTENGFEDVIKKGRAEAAMETMSFNQLVEYLAQNTTLIKTPILFQGKDKLLIGYHEEEIGKFLPRNEKNKQMKKYYHAM